MEGGGGSLPVPHMRPSRQAASAAMRQLKAGKGTRRLFMATSHADLRPHMRERHQNLPAQPQCMHHGSHFQT